jgi:hypothetical protein
MHVPHITTVLELYLLLTPTIVTSVNFFFSTRFTRKGRSLDKLRQALHLSSYTKYKPFMSAKSILKAMNKYKLHTVRGVITSIFMFATTSQDLCNLSCPNKQV